MANIYSIYKVTNNIDNKIYIGSTSKTLVERFKEHLYNATRNYTIKLHIHMRQLGFEHFNIELICEKFTHNPTFSEQCEMNKYDEHILLNMNAADVSAKLSPYSKERLDTIRLIKLKISDHNILNEVPWDLSLINFDSPNWILIKLLSKINDGIFPELFTDGRLCFYN